MDDVEFYAIQQPTTPPPLLAYSKRHSLLSLYARKNLLAEASQYMHLFYQESEQAEVALAERLEQVQEEIRDVGTYRHTLEELTYGARLAWRNSVRCIGRLHWSSLQVRDMRHLTEAGDIFAALIEHIKLATNHGKIRPLMTVFAPQEPDAPGIRLWNSQLIRYAGYVQADGTVVGDPLNIELTEQIMQLGWTGGKRTAFDILPLVIHVPGQSPRLFEIPPEIVLEVPIEHPRYPWFADLHMKWYALPVISNMRLEIGGISYTAAPFNGWYMGTEIGARNFGDRERYNVLPLIAEKMGLQTRLDRTLWRDQALVELNIAVLHSFAQQGVTIVDHHTASRQFILHEEQEHKAGRCVAADWGWIVPPMSGSLTPVFHKEYEHTITTPNFFAQPDPWHYAMPAPVSSSGHDAAAPRLLTLPVRHKV